MKYVWQDLPEKKNCFTVRNATMINLNTGKVISYYSANTKIVVVQKCVTPEKTYYRTADAAYHYLNYAFEASAFGLPNEKAPSAPSPTPRTLGKSAFKSKPDSRTSVPAKKQTSNQEAATPKGGEGEQHVSWLKKLLRRIHDKTKNS